MKRWILLVSILTVFSTSCKSSENNKITPPTIVPKISKIETAEKRQAAWITGIHTNSFVEKGIATESEVKEKVEQTYKQLFYGKDGMVQDGGKALLVSVGDDMAFINSVDSKDIRSEGMSYGMIIAVMMDDQTVFNKLWKFSKTYMQHSTGERNGYFAWSLKNTSPFTINDPNPASDGEEYYVMALMFAKNHWGNGIGIYNYEVEANSILKEMIQKNNSINTALINPTKKQIVFTPDTKSEEFTDPSYHLPAFTKLWAKWAKENNVLFEDMTKISRDLFVKSSNATTGLFPDYSTFEGVPQYMPYNGNSNKAGHDSHRVVQNIAMDYLWFKEDPREVKLVEKFLDFAYNEYNNGKNGFVGVYNLDGSPAVEYSTQSQVAMNAVGAMITDKEYSKFFIEKLWNQSTPDGMWRYYNGMLHMLGLLHVSGEFKIYGNPNLKK